MDGAVAANCPDEPLDGPVREQVSSRARLLRIFHTVVIGSSVMDSSNHWYGHAHVLARYLRA